MDFNLLSAKGLVVSQNQFPVSFDDAWQWLNFSTKGNAKRHFKESDFIEDTDFKVFIIKDKNPLGGRPSEQFYLTIECFKMWAMMTNTTKGKEIRKYFLECEKQLKEKTEPKKTAISFYSDRIALLPSSLEQNSDYWTILEESGHLLLEIERLGYPVEKFDLLDGSVGKRWSAYRKINNLGNKTITLLYKFNDQRGSVNVTAYPYSELGEFKFWLKNVYTPNLLPKYLESKYSALVLSN